MTIYDVKIVKIQEPTGTLISQQERKEGDVACLDTERGRWRFFSIPLVSRPQWKAESFMKVHRVLVVMHLSRCNEGGSGGEGRERKEKEERLCSLAEPSSVISM